MEIINILKIINIASAIIFSLCYAYQMIYVFVPFFKKAKKYENTHLHKFAVVISARNEKNVITNLIESIKNQTYPKELIEIFVIADNCTDNTAELSKKAGATVWERNDEIKKGKGYALDFAFQRFLSDKEKYDFDGFFIFDADNVLEENYIEEVNKIFTSENRIITGYRNSKNFDRNWITAGYSLWFLRESQYLNRSRHILKTSAAVSGTGFMFAREVIENLGGWKYFLLTEDIEFTVDSVINGIKIAYCEKAMLYDEQPIKFSQSWNQRMRWAKGYIQIFRKYGLKLIKSVLRFKSFACYDISMATLPAIVLTVACTVVNLVAAGYGILSKSGIEMVVQSLLATGCYTYVLFFTLGAITVCTEWKKIHANPFKKIAYLFTFPIFMLTYIPITLVALFKRVEWTPIYHNEAKSLSDVKQMH